MTFENSLFGLRNGLLLNIFFIRNVWETVPSNCYISEHNGCWKNCNIGVKVPTEVLALATMFPDFGEYNNCKWYHQNSHFHIYVWGRGSITGGGGFKTSHVCFQTTWGNKHAGFKPINILLGNSCVRKRWTRDSLEVAVLFFASIKVQSTLMPSVACVFCLSCVVLLGRWTGTTSWERLLCSREQHTPRAGYTPPLRPWTTLP